MKRPLMLLLAFFLAISNYAPAWAARGARLHYSTMFNPETLGTVSGEVVKVEKTVSGSGRDFCILATIKTGKGQMRAVLGPLSFMRKKGYLIAPGDRVTIKGSMITIGGEPHLIAMEVAGDRTMILRDRNGRPAWAVGDDWHAR